ncbi:MAG: YceI family protein [Bacteroidota bacterium]
MRIIISFIVCSFIFQIQLLAQSNSYQLSTSKSKLTWTGKAAFSSYSLSGTIRAKSGTLLTEENQIKNAHLTINTKTIHSSIKQLKQHLSSEDFFDVKKFPAAHFELNHFVPLASGAHLAQGWLTIKGTKKAFECPVTLALNEQQIVISGVAIINRTEFGVNYNSPTIFTSLKEHAIADDFELNFELIFE